jgi:hypothetical protein
MAALNHESICIEADDTDSKNTNSLILLEESQEEA